MRRRIMDMILGGIFAILLTSSFTVFANSVTQNISVTYRNIRIVVNGEPITPRDGAGNVVEPFIFGGTTFLPIRAVSQALGMYVQWDGDTSTVYIGATEDDLPGVNEPPAPPAPSSTPAPQASTASNLTPTMAEIYNNPNLIIASHVYQGMTFFIVESVIRNHYNPARHVNIFLQDVTHSARVASFITADYAIVLHSTSFRSTDIYQVGTTIHDFDSDFIIALQRRAVTLEDAIAQVTGNITHAPPEPDTVPVLSGNNLNAVLLTEAQLRAMERTAVSVANSRSAIIHPQRQMTAAEISAWSDDYWALGGPNAFELEVVRLINMERANAGLSPLQLCPRLMMAARFKTQNMVDLRYGGHHNPIYAAGRPVHESPTIMARLFGVRGNISENLADRMHYHEAFMAVDAWIRSPGHSANILNPNSTIIGIGALENPNMPHHILGDITVTAKFG
ncbi:MAG: stalk domain-containing protein [Defluviitaleaceae bacterium]|nr:stalk domain-containing protein [Defluviitaleaceae bacterium]